MQRYSSVQPYHRSQRANNDYNSQNNGGYNNMNQDNTERDYDTGDIVVSKIKREDIQIKQSWSKAPKTAIPCGKHHDDNSDYSQASASRWLETKIKKRNQSRILLKAVYMQRKEDKDYQSWKDNELGGNLTNKNATNVKNENTANNMMVVQHIKQERVLWKKRMINELHDINKFMNAFNGLNRSQRAELKRQQIIGDLKFNEGDQKRLEQHKEQTYRMNQLHKRLYGHESLERIQAQGIVKELLQDFTRNQISIQNKSKIQLNNNQNQSQKQIPLQIKEQKNITPSNNLDLQNKCASIEELKLQYPYKQKSSSMHAIPIKNIKDKSIGDNQTIIQQKQPNPNQTNQQSSIENDNQNKVLIRSEKKKQKTRSEIQFQNIDEINSNISNRLILDYNKSNLYTFAESQAIRNEQSQSVLQLNQTKIQNMQSPSIQVLPYNYQQSGFNSIIFDQEKSQDQLFSKIISQSQIEQQQTKSKNNLNNTSIPQYSQNQDTISFNINLNNQIMTYNKLDDDNNQKQSKNQKRDTIETQRSSLHIVGDQELGKDYFKYLKSNNEVEYQKREDQLKEKLKDNQYCQKILAMKKIEKISKLQKFYEDYSNHVSQKVLKEVSDKLYIPKPDYKSLVVLPNMQKKAENQEEEKLRLLKEEEERRNAKKIRVFKKFQSQVEIDKIAISRNANDNYIEDNLEKQNNKSLDNHSKNKINLNKNSSLIKGNTQRETVQGINSVQENLRLSLNNKQTDRIILNKTQIHRSITPNYIQQKQQNFFNLQTNKQNIKNNNEDNNDNDQAINFQVEEMTQRNNQLLINQIPNSDSWQGNASPLMKKQKGINSNSQSINQETYYTPMKLKDEQINNFGKGIEQNDREITTAFNRQTATTLDSPEIQYKVRINKNSSCVLQNQKRCESVYGSRQQFNEKTNNTLAAFDPNSPNKKSSMTIISHQSNAKPISNQDLLQKVINFNQQCKLDSEAVNQITKNLLFLQKRNLKSFTKLNKMANQMN